MKTENRQPRKPIAKQKALQLFNKDTRPTEIAEKVGVTIKTAYKWVNHWKKEKEAKAETLQLFENRIKTLLKDPKAKTSDIKNLVFAMERLKKRPANLTI